MNTSIARTQQALVDLAAGRPVVVTTDSSRDDQGHVIVAAEKATTSALAFLVQHTSGFVCAALSGEVCDRLGLTPMSGTGNANLGNTYTVTVDAITDVTTGISAADRARTVRSLADPQSTPDDFTRPGHVVPIRTRAAGVLAADEPAEAAVDLVRLAGLRDVCVLGALVSGADDTRMADAQESTAFARDHRLTSLSVHDVVAYRRNTEVHVRRMFDVDRVMAPSVLRTTGFHSDATGDDYVAYRMGDPHSSITPLVAIHQESDLAPHVPGQAPESDLSSAFASVEHHGNGLVLVRRRRSWSTAHPIDDQLNVAEPFGRHADIAQILRELGLSSPTLLNGGNDLVATLVDLGFPDAAVSSLNIGTEPPMSSIPEPVVIEGTVTRGDQRGRELGFPTANIELADDRGHHQGLPDGVWAGRCFLRNGEQARAAISVGRRSTFYGRTGPRLLEAHLLDFDGNLYDQHITVLLDHWIRGQAAFSSKDELIAALESDVVHTRTLLDTHPPGVAAHSPTGRPTRNGVNAE
jgi:3,4-dihydroxy 2-butanone 4-phosphate synthase/GTP cyclohydrolase II